MSHSWETKTTSRPRSHDCASASLPSVPQGRVPGCPRLFCLVITVFRLQGFLGMAPLGRKVITSFQMPLVSSSGSVPVTKPSSDLCLCFPSPRPVAWRVRLDPSVSLSLVHLVSPSPRVPTDSVYSNKWVPSVMVGREESLQISLLIEESCHWLVGVLGWASLQKERYRLLTGKLLVHRSHLICSLLPSPLPRSAGHTQPELSLGLSLSHTRTAHLNISEVTSCL